MSEVTQRTAPCPFCGVYAAEVYPLDSNPNYFTACCNRCGAEGPQGKSEDEAWARWNKRT